jgi:hypothetical protein
MQGLYHGEIIITQVYDILFDVRVRTHKSLRTEIVDQLIQLIGGQIWIDRTVKSLDCAHASTLERFHQQLVVHEHRLGQDHERITRKVLVQIMQPIN